jgi:hypothetical protein
MAAAAAASQRPAVLTSRMILLLVLFGVCHLHVDCSNVTPTTKDR